MSRSLLAWPEAVKLLRRMVWVLSLAGTLAACSGAAAVREPEAQVVVQAEERSQQITVGFLLSSLYNPLYVSLQKGAIESASRLDIELIVREAGNDAEKQLQQIDELLALGVDALILNPVDSAAVSGGVRLAESANVPVVTVERRVNGATISAHVASDNVAGGEMAASYLVDMLQEEGKVVEIMGIPGTSVAQDRSSGFNQVIATYPAVSVEARRVANFDRQEARRIFAELLAQIPELDGVFAHNDAMILGAIDAAEEVGRAREIVFIGFDGTPDAIDALEDGALTATIAQQPTEMGRIAIELVNSLLYGDAVSQSVAVDLALVTR